MELSERCIAQLEKEGFPTIFEQSDPAGTTYPLHSHEEMVALLITDGSINVTMQGVAHTLHPGDRIDIPSNVPHSAIVGASGCNYVVGEK